MSAEVKWLELPGSRTRVLEAGAHDGRPVIFLHGVTSSAATWTPYLAALPDGVRGIAYDALGCGYAERSGPRRPITRDDLREQLLALADALALERFRSVGHSLGCSAALGAAWREPERVEALLLSDPAALGRRRLNLELRLARHPVTARMLEAVAPAAMPLRVRTRLREFAHAGRVDPELREREAGHAFARPRELVRGFVDITGHTDMRRPSPEAERYRGIGQPVWILRGAEDRDWMPASHEARYRELIPDARVMRWDGVGHSPHIEVPERFGGLLADFLAATG